MDHLGRQGESATVNIFVNALPQVSWLSPANNFTFVEPANIVLASSSTDSDGAIQTVQFLSNSNFIGSDNASPYAMTWMNVQKGVYNLLTRAVDNRGATNSARPICPHSSNYHYITGERRKVYRINQSAKPGSSVKYGRPQIGKHRCFSAAICCHASSSG